MKKDYEKIMKERLARIDKLVDTPNIIREYSIGIITKIKNKAAKRSNVSALDNWIKALNNIAESSIKENYNIIYSSSCILAVSVLNSILEEYFIDYIQEHPENIPDKKKDELKFKLSELSDYDYNIGACLWERILKKDKAINFHDLQATLKTIKEYKIKTVKIDDNLSRKIIFYQQCRHIISHNDWKITDNFLRRMQKLDANIKSYKKDDDIQFNDDDWKDMKKTFIKFVKSITK